MTLPRGLACLAAGVLAVGAAATACTSNRNVESALRPVSLPDLSQMAETVQTQLRDGYMALTEVTANTAATSADRGEAYGEFGKLLMAAESFDMAELSFLNAHALMPDDMRWPYYLGHLYRTRGQPAETVVFFAKAAELRPDDAITLVWLGEAYLDQGRPEAAESVLAKAIALQPGSAAALFGLGRAALAKREYGRAKQYLENALGLAPRALSIHIPLAQAYRGLGDLATAEAHLRERGTVPVPQPDPLMDEVNGLLQSAEAYEFLGDNALGNGDWIAAGTHFRRGVELAPDNPTLRHKLGTALALAGDHRGAVAQFEEVIRQSPRFVRTRLSLGMLLESTGERQEAIAQLSAAVKYDPLYAEAHLRLAQILRQSGRLEESLSHLETAVGVDPRHGEARFEYAMTLIAVGREREAREQLIQGTRIHPDRPEFSRALEEMK